MTDLSVKAKEICKQNYKTNCGKCPIRTACVAPIKHSRDGLNKSITEINLMAEDNI